MEGDYKGSSAPSLCSAITLVFSSFSFLKIGLKFIYLFILRERETETETERDAERIPSRLCTGSTEPDTGLHLGNCEIMT